MTSPTRAGWYADPFKRFEQRYFDGAGWTSHVESAGVQITDPGPIPSEGNPSGGLATDPEPAADPRPTTAPVPPADRPAGVLPIASAEGISLTDERRRQMGMLAVACGVAIVLAAFMTWGSSRTNSVSGIGMKVGYVTAVCGVVIALYGAQAFKPGPIRRRRSTLAAIIIAVSLSALVSTLFEDLDSATFGSQAVEAREGAHLTAIAAVVAIWPYVLFRRDFWQRRRAHHQAVARSATAPSATPLPPGIPPAPR